MLKKNYSSQAIIIDGVVGVGKTSLMEILSTKYDFPTFIEPVTENPLLDQFYRNRKRYAFALQIYFLNQRFKMLKDAQLFTHPVLMDRSIYGDIIFAHMLNKQGDMSNEEFALYQDLLTNMLEYIRPPMLMIYLQTSTDHAIENIRKRGRPFEQNVEFTYWEDLNKEYDAYFSQYSLSPVLKLNVDHLDFVHNKKDQQLILDMVDSELKHLQLL